MSKLKEQIRELGSRYGVTKVNELGLVYLALEEKDDQYIQDIFTPKKWG